MPANPSAEPDEIRDRASAGDLAALRKSLWNNEREGMSQLDDMEGSLFDEVYIKLDEIEKSVKGQMSDLGVGADACAVPPACDAGGDDEVRRAPPPPAPPRGCTISISNEKPMRTSRRLGALRRLSALRRLRASRRLNASRRLGAISSPRTDPWVEEWYEEFACWFVSLPLPTQGQLGSCFGALSIHLGSRLDASWRAARASLGRRGEPNPTKPSAQLPVAESGCAWVGESESLGLPSFPEFPTNLDFNLPPIPRLLPPWEQLRALRHEAPQQEHARLRWREEPAGWLSPAQPAGRGGAHATQMAQATL